MNYEVTTQDPEAVEPPMGEFELGTWIGRRQAFSAVAGKASAADIDCLRRIRDSRLYKCKVSGWEEFCAQYLGASKASVNRAIHCLAQYGPQYFALTQLTRVPPRVFEAIAPSLTEEGLTLDGETFALTAENAEQLAAAVAELRKRAETPGTAPPRSPFEVVEKRFEDLIGRLQTLAPALDAGQKAALGGLLARLRETACAAGLPLAA